MKSLLVLAAIAAPLVAQTGVAPAAVSPYWIPSSCQWNTAYPEPASNVCRTLLQATCQSFNQCWWRDTTAQNMLANHTETDFPGTVLHPFSASNLDVWVWASHDAGNAIALVSPTSNTYILIGMGGASDAAATVAKARFLQSIPNFASMTLRGLIYLDTDPTSWAGSSIFTGGQTVPIYAHSNFPSAYQRYTLTAGARDARTFKMMGVGLPWGADSFLGIGSGYKYPWPPPTPTPPNQLITGDTNLYLGTVTITLKPAIGENASLAVWIDQFKILILGEPFGKYLPNVAPLDGPPLPLDRVVTFLNSAIVLEPQYLVELHAPPLSDSALILSALRAQKDAMSFLNTETIRRINALEHIDAIAATLTLPDAVANSPWAQPLATSIASAVRAVYHDQMGWFNGDYTSLPVMTRLEHAQRLVALIGPSQALTGARKALEEQTVGGAAWALQIAYALSVTYPSQDVSTILREALRRLAYSERSAQRRNFYLTELLLLGPAY